MSLVNELQESAERDDVIVVLRRTKRFCAKLGENNTLQWANNESDGYPDNSEDIPEYRNITFCLGYHFDCHVSGNYIVNGVKTIPGFVVKRPLLKPISEVVNIIASIKDNLFYGEPFHTENPDLIKQFGHNQFVLQANSAEIRAIPERIKDVILDWACSLELAGVAGVTGDDQSFSAGDKGKAKNATFNISHCSVGQIADSGTNLVGGSNNGTV